MKVLSYKDGRWSHLEKDELSDNSEYFKLLSSRLSIITFNSSAEFLLVITPCTLILRKEKLKGENIFIWEWLFRNIRNNLCCKKKKELSNYFFLNTKIMNSRDWPNKNANLN